MEACRYARRLQGEKCAAAALLQNFFDLDSPPSLLSRNKLPDGAPRFLRRCHRAVTRLSQSHARVGASFSLAHSDQRIIALIVMQKSKWLSLLAGALVVSSVA